jgi:hypothetical protein
MLEFLDSDSATCACLGVRRASENEAAAGAGGHDCGRGSKLAWVLGLGSDAHGSGDAHSNTAVPHQQVPLWPHRTSNSAPLTPQRLPHLFDLGIGQVRAAQQHPHVLAAFQRLERNLQPGGQAGERRGRETGRAAQTDGRAWGACGRAVCQPMVLRHGPAWPGSVARRCAVKSVLAWRTLQAACFTTHRLSASLLPPPPPLLPPALPGAAPAAPGSPLALAPLLLPSAPSPSFPVPLPFFFCECVEAGKSGRVACGAA